MTASASKIGWRRNSRKSIFIPTVKKKMPSKRPLNGSTTVSMAFPYSVSASTNPAMKAPSAIDRFAWCAMSPAATMTNNPAATKSSVECVLATRRKSGRSSKRPNRMMRVIAIAARSNAPVRLPITDVLLPIPSTEINRRSGMTARSCAKSTEKPARPAVVFSLPWSDRSSSTIAVDESERLIPIMTATSVFWPTATATAESSSAVTSTWRLPIPKTSRRIVIRRLKESPRPIKNNRKTTPSSAMPATFWASVTVTQ